MIACRVTAADIGAQIERPPSESFQLKPKADPLARVGRRFGATLYQATDGKVWASFPVGKQKVPVTWPDRAAAERGFALLEDHRLTEARLAKEAGRAAREIRLEVPERPFSWAEIDPTLRVDQLVHGEIPAALTDPRRYVTGDAAIPLGQVVSVRAGLRGLGRAGQALYELFTRRQEIADRLLNRWVAELETILKPLTDDEINTVLRRHREFGEAASPAVQQANQHLTQLFERIANDAINVGLDVPRFFDPRTYWPYRYDIAMLKDQKRADALAKALFKSGKAKSLEEAFDVLERQGLGTSRDRAIRRIMEDIRKQPGGERKTTDQLRGEAIYVLERYISQSGAKRSSHLEYERLANLPPIENARRALSAYFFDVADRLATVQTLGIKEVYAKGLIGEVEREFGSRSASFAREVLDAELNRTRNRLEGFWAGLYDWQANKLSLSVLANATQPLNALMRTGLMDFLRGIGLFAKNPRQAIQHAKEIGALTHDILSDIRVTGAGELMGARAGQSLPKRIVRETAEFSLTLFNLIENVNRTVSAYAGEAYFRRILDDFRANPGDALTVRRLRELGFTPEAVARANEGELTEMMYLAGKRISDQTQFRPTIQQRPLWAQHPVGRFAFQFKSFALGQAQFVTNEIFGPHKDMARRARALAVLFTAFPAAGVAVTEVRQRLMGQTFTSEMWEQAKKDPTFTNIVVGLVVASATIGSLGIIADATATAAIGNKFALTAFAVSPALSTGINALDIASSVVKGAINRDAALFERALRTGSREFGGLGTALVKSGEVFGLLPPTGREAEGGEGGFGGFRGF